jgi:hypothetical protein
MPKIIFITFLYSLIVITGGGPAYAQKPPEDTQLVTPTPEAASKTDGPKQISTVILENNRLSVDFVNVSFGEILLSIGKKAGFLVEGYSKVFSMKVTTKFNDLDLDSGIMRLFSLVKEPNYHISYDSKGSISKIKIYNISTVDSVPPASSPATGPAAVTPRTRRSRRINTSAQPAVPPPPPTVPQASQPGTPDQEETTEPSGED